MELEQTYVTNLRPTDEENSRFLCLVDNTLDRASALFKIAFTIGFAT